VALGIEAHARFLTVVLPPGPNIKISVVMVISVYTMGLIITIFWTLIKSTNPSIMGLT